MHELGGGKRFVHIAAALAALVAGVASIARADSPSPVPSATDTVTNVSVSSADLATLLKAVAMELTPNTGTVVVDIKPATEMPAYDPLVFYAGIGAESKHPKAPAVWSTKPPPPPDEAYQNALEGAFLLAVMDAGEAGPKWKAIYDATAAADATLPKSAPDPYLHRHELIKQIQALQKAGH